MKGVSALILIGSLFGLFGSASLTVSANPHSQVKTGWLTPDHFHALQKKPKASKIDTLRALRLHNITRNYQNKPVSIDAQLTQVTPSHLAYRSRQAKIAKVRQWESVYR